MKKGKQPKGAMRAQLARATAERDVAQTRIAMLERELEEQRHRHETTRYYVERIFRLIGEHQPYSSLLPEGLRSSKFDPTFTRMVEPPRFPTRVEDVPPYDVMKPIVLHDLMVRLEENFATWDRLVTIDLKPSGLGVSETRIHYKLSNEVLHSETARKYLSEDVTRRFFRALEQQFK